MRFVTISDSVVDLFDNSCRFARAAGVLPYIMRGRHIEVSKMLALYDITMISFNLSIDLFLLYVTITYQKSMPLVKLLVQIAQQAVGTGTTAMSFLWVIQSKRTLQEALDELVKFEILVKPKGVSSSARWLGVTYLILFAFAIIDFFSMIEPELVMKITIIARFHTSAWMMFSILSNFTSLIKLVDKCYQALSDSIVDNLKSSPSLKDTQKAAEHLVSACEALNATFGPQMLLITSTSFVLITGSIYTVIVTGKMDGNLIGICWALLYTMMMLHMISSCTSVVQTANEFEKTLYRTVLEDRSGNLSLEVRSCLHFTNSRKVKFHAFGFFPIDFTLAGSMFAAAATYLFILIQTGSNGKSSNN